MPDKLPIEVQKIIKTFFDDCVKNKDGSYTTYEQQVEAYSQFSNKIKPYLEKPFLPFVLDV